MLIKVLGLYPVEEADQPCHLVELSVSNFNGTLDLGQIYVADPNGVPGNEQVP
jgi:hypothetical protein